MKRLTDSELDALIGEISGSPAALSARLLTVGKELMFRAVVNGDIAVLNRLFDKMKGFTDDEQLSVRQWFTSRFSPLTLKADNTIKMDAEKCRGLLAISDAKHNFSAADLGQLANLGIQALEAEEWNKHPKAKAEAVLAEQKAKAKATREANKEKALAEEAERKATLARAETEARQAKARVEELEEKLNTQSAQGAISYGERVDSMIALLLEVDEGAYNMIEAVLQGAIKRQKAA